MWDLTTWECVKTIDAGGYVVAMIMFDDKLISTSSEKIKVLLLLLHLNQFVTSTSNQSGARKNHCQNTKISAMRIKSFRTFPCVHVPDLIKTHKSTQVSKTYHLLIGMGFCLWKMRENSGRTFGCSACYLYDRRRKVCLGLG